MIIRPASPSDHPKIITLNQQHISVTSELNLNQLETLINQNAITLVVEIEETVVGFLIGILEDSPYQNQNFRWFSDRLKNFLYIDRVVISSSHSGTGIGQNLYKNLIAQATQSNIHQLAAEMDINPPNKASLNFHKKLGFVPIGKRLLENGKTVSMQLKQIDHPTKP